MKCPFCGNNDSKVIDSRPTEDNQRIRRRRECLSCQMRFTTYEVIDAFQPIVLKKDGSKEYFDKNKLLSGILKACQKRPVDAEAITAEIESELLNSLAKLFSNTYVIDLYSYAPLYDEDFYRNFFLGGHLTHGSQ